MAGFKVDSNEEEVWFSFDAGVSFSFIRNTHSVGFNDFGMSVGAWDSSMPHFNVHAWADRPGLIITAKNHPYTKPCFQVKAGGVAEPMFEIGPQGQLMTNQIEADEDPFVQSHSLHVTGPDGAVYKLPAHRLG